MWNKMQNQRDIYDNCFKCLIYSERMMKARSTKWYFVITCTQLRYCGDRHNMYHPRKSQKTIYIQVAIPALEVKLDNNWTSYTTKVIIIIIIIIIRYSWEYKESSCMLLLQDDIVTPKTTKDNNDILNLYLILYEYKDNLLNKMDFALIINKIYKSMSKVTE